MTDQEWCEARAAADGLPGHDDTVPADELERVRARGWTTAQGMLPTGQARTLIKAGDPQRQREMIAANIGVH